MSVWERGGQRDEAAHGLHGQEKAGNLKHACEQMDANEPLSDNCHTVGLTIWGALPVGS